VDRIVSAFPPGQQQQVRSTLADSLRAVVCQYLMKEKNGPGRVLAVELLVNNEAVSNLIRKGKAFQLPSVISTSREQGMQLMDTDLMRLTKEGRISAGDAYVKAVSKKDFEPFVEEEEKAAAQKRAPNFKAVAVPTPASPQPQAPAARPASSRSSSTARHSSKVRIDGRAWACSEPTEPRVSSTVPEPPISFASSSLPF